MKNPEQFKGQKSEAYKKKEAMRQFLVDYNNVFPDRPDRLPTIEERYSQKNFHRSTLQRLLEHIPDRVREMNEIIKRINAAKAANDLEARDELIKEARVLLMKPIEDT